jgi:hypothetical protein
MFTQTDHVDPLLEEIPITSTGEEMYPKVLDLAMMIAKKIVTPLVLLLLKLEHNIMCMGISCVCYT